MTIDPNKIAVFIKIINEGLESRDSYRMICSVNTIELQELRNHFTIIEDGELRNNNILIFSHK